MNLNEHYDKLLDSALSEYKKYNFDLDPLINSKTDLRRGLTLITKPDEAVLNKISIFFDDVSKIDRKLYYYPLSDIHITVLSIISCYEGFKINKNDVLKYVSIIKDSLTAIKKTKIHFKGITASNSCIMLKGFPDNDMLNILRENLRKNFKNSGLSHSIDKRYRLSTAHSTVIRFQERPENTIEFLKILEKYRDFDFGSIEVNSFDFVYNNWYLQKEFTEKLHFFKI